MNVGKSIKVALAKRGWKQNQLAAMLGVAPSSLSAIANQRSCTGQTLQKIADAFEMPVSEFVALGED